MRERIANPFTPQDKNIAVNDRFGNSGIKKQQGSSVLKYDTLPLDGRTTLNFFEGAAARNFPLSNCGSDGNKLGVGNTLVVERIYLTILTKGEDGLLIRPDTIETAPDGTIQMGELNLSIANSTVLKNFPVLSTVPYFNYSSGTIRESVYELDTNIVIPPLLEYIMQLRLPAYSATAYDNLYLRLTIEGSGSLIAPRTTF
jgi:hypothetical protein